MRASRKLWALMVASVLLGGCLAALAEEKMADVDGRLDKMSKELNLTGDQKTKLKPILQNQSDAWKAIMDDKSLTPMQRRVKMKDVHDKIRPRNQCGADS